METRPWDQWDRPGVADEINRIWNTSGSENAYREKNASLAKPHLKSGDALLEVGCGTGLMYALFRAVADVRYVGVDTSDEMLKIARKAFPEGDFRNGDGYQLEFEDKSFDAVVSFDVLLHLPDIVPFIREMVRVAKRLVIFTIRIGPKTYQDQEAILKNNFLYNLHSLDDAQAKIKEASGETTYEMIDLCHDWSTLWIGAVPG